MKNLIKVTLLLFAVGCFVGCTDLEYQLTDSVATNDDGGGGLEATDLLETAYRRIGETFQTQDNAYALLSHTTDEMMGPTRGTDWSDNGVWRALHNHTWDPTHPYVVNGWNAINQSVFQTNVVLAANPTTQQAAEARFIRAFFNFYNVDLFGVAPFREANEGPEIDPRVFNRAEAVDFILEDIDAAIPNLPDVAEPGQASKDAARALKAKVLLNKAVYLAANPAGPYDFQAADMNEVVELIDAMSGYSLAADYFDNFAPDNGAISPELIFSLPNEAGASFGGGNGAASRYFKTLHYNQNPGGWNGFVTLSDFYNKFEAGDQRLGGERAGLTDVSGMRTGFLVGQQFNENGEALKDRPGNDLVFTEDVALAGNNERRGIRVVKYVPDFSNLNVPANNYVVFRWGDMLLMKAEALLRSGDAGGALAIVNELRDVRGASALASLDEQALLDERGFEMYWEGWRRNDQIRFGQYTRAYQEKPESASTRVLFPIPQQAIDSNPNLTQNDGY
ncbi:MAG: RagB/SusD family nutrient uptake outer membrane protein [Bacteroidota bacterium]